MLHLFFKAIRHKKEHTRHLSTGKVVSIRAFDYHDNRLRRKSPGPVKEFSQPKGDFTIYDNAVAPTKPDISTPLKLAVIAYENSVRHADIEHGAFFDAHGGVVLQKVGDANKITIYPHEEPLINGAVFTHVHPSGSNFSFDDIVRAGNFNLAELRAVTANMRFSITLGQGAWPTNRHLIKLIAKHEASAHKEIDRMAELEEIGIRHVQAEAEHVLWRKVCADLGLTYRREKS